MTVSEIDGLLYLPHKARRDLERALRIPALSPGWQGSFRDLLDQAHDGTAAKLAWEGLRKLRVVALDRESENVISVPAGAGRRQARRARPARAVPDRAAAPGPRARPRCCAPTRCPTCPNTKSYRISVKHEPHGAASGYITTKLRVGDVIEAGAPRGSFVLRPGDRPVVLISAGVGATPVLAMLHVLAAERTDPRGVVPVQRPQRRRAPVRAARPGALLAQLPNAHRVDLLQPPRSRTTAHPTTSTSPDG